MKTIKSKLPNVGTTIFTVMSQMANDNDAINLSQGFPDFDCDKHLKSLVNYYIKNGYNQYAPMAGIPELRSVLSKKIKKLYGRNYDPETEITITAGATQAIYTAISAIVSIGDEVIIFTPAYDCYESAIKLNGGLTKHVRLSYPDYTINFEKLKKAITKKTKAIIINSPHNPSGSILNRKQMLELQRTLKGTDIILISDEVYEHIIFDGEEHQSVARYPDLFKRSIIVSSFGKTYHNTGWKMGYCYAPQGLMKEFRKVHQFNVFCVNRPLQHAFSDYINDDKSHLSLSKFYQKKRNYFLKKIASSRFKPLPCSGTYFQLLDYSSISKDKDVDFAKQLVEEAGVAAIPVSVFYKRPPSSKVLRFCFAKNKKTLDQGAEILCSL
ncbi:MAG: aminotransferase class I/II-fold pyridoxal phosphate-dependent enzyme [Flavobacteriales bacterium]|nr:aminotransferase class I/II-fold pyridoxal phosphate-dependent enzyme [Flavobacteriales bacterium]